MAEHAAPTEQAGIPQLDFAAFPNQIFWLVVFLVILFLIVSRVVLPRIGGILDQREKRIRENLAEAERLDERANSLNEEAAGRLSAARTAAEQIVAEARTEARAMQNRAIMEATETIAARSAEAESRIAEIRSGARVIVREIASAAALEIVNKIIPGHDADRNVGRAVDVRIAGTEH